MIQIHADIFKSVSGILKITEWVLDLLDYVEHIHCKLFHLDSHRSDDYLAQF